MAEEKRNLCAQIPISLHSRVRQEQGAGNSAMISGTFQVPAELFEDFKAYLQRNNFKQKEFFLCCIQSALAEERDAEEASGSEPEPQETDQTE